MDIKFLQNSTAWCRVFGALGRLAIYKIDEVPFLNAMVFLKLIFAVVRVSLQPISHQDFSASATVPDTRKKTSNLTTFKPGWMSQPCPLNQEISSN